MIAYLFVLLIQLSSL